MLTCSGIESLACLGTYSPICPGIDLRTSPGIQAEGLKGSQTGREKGNQGWTGLMESWWKDDGKMIGGWFMDGWRLADKSKRQYSIALCTIKKVKDKKCLLLIGLNWFYFEQLAGLAKPIPLKKEFFTGQTDLLLPGDGIRHAQPFPAFGSSPG